jgi:hypothetical protein
MWWILAPLRSSCQGRCAYGSCVVGGVRTCEPTSRSRAPRGARGRRGSPRRAFMSPILCGMLRSWTLSPTIVVPAGCARSITPPPCSRGYGASNKLLCEPMFSSRDVKPGCQISETAKLPVRACGACRVLILPVDPGDRNAVGDRRDCRGNNSGLHEASAGRRSATQSHPIVQFTIPSTAGPRQLPRCGCGRRQVILPCTHPSAALISPQ